MSRITIVRRRKNIFCGRYCRAHGAFCRSHQVKYRARPIFAPPRAQKYRGNLQKSR